MLSSDEIDFVIETLCKTHLFNLKRFVVVTV